VSRTVVCVVVGTVLVVLAVTAAVLFLPELSSFSATPDVARLLPGDTQVYLKLSDIPALLAQLRGGARDVLGAAATTEPGRTGPVLVGEGMAKNVRSLHVSFQGAGAQRKRTKVGLIVIAELKEPTPLEQLLPPSVTAQLRPDGEHAGVQVQRLDILPLTAALGAPLELANAGKRVILSTDRKLLEGVLDALPGGREDSLAEQADFRTIRSVQVPGDVEVYVALPVLLRGLGNATPKDVRAQLLDLVGLRYLSVTADYALGAGTVRLLMKFDSPVYRLLAQADREKSIPGYLPQSTVAFVAASIADGQDAWRRVTALAADVLTKTGQVGGETEWGRKIAEAEKSLNVSFGQVASLVKEAGVFLDGRFGADGLCVYARVRDPVKAERIMKQVIASDGFKRARRAASSTSYARQGATVYVSDEDMVWCVVDECLFIARRRETIEHVLAARREVKALSDLAAYRQTTALLPAQNGWLGFVRTGQLAADAFPQAGNELEGWFHAVCVSAYAGVVELRWRQSKKVDLRGLLAEAAFRLRGRIRPRGNRDVAAPPTPEE